MAGRMLRVALLVALALSLVGCGAIGLVLSAWDVVAIELRGPTTAQPGQPQTLTVFVDLFGVDPEVSDERRAPLQDPRIYTWTVVPSDGAAASPDGVFTATQPGRYHVTAKAFDLAGGLTIEVAPSHAGTYAGSFNATAKQAKTGKLAPYAVPVTLTIAADGTVTATAHFEGRTPAGSVYLDATATGTVAKNGDVTTSGTMLLGPSKKKAKSGPFALSGSIADGTLYGMVQLMDGRSAGIELAIDG